MGLCLFGIAPYSNCDSSESTVQTVSDVIGTGWRVTAQERLVKGHFNLRNWAVYGEIGCAWLMSAFPESGRSGRQNLGEIKVRFRPQAVIREEPCYSISEMISRTSAWKESRYLSPLTRTSARICSLNFRARASLRRCICQDSSVLRPD